MSVRPTFEAIAADIYRRAGVAEDAPASHRHSDRLVASITAEVLRHVSGAISKSLAEEAEPEKRRSPPGPANCNMVRAHVERAFRGDACERCGKGPCPFYNEDGSSKISGGRGLV